MNSTPKALPDRVAASGILQEGSRSARRVLILTSGLGYGHMAAAAAISQALRSTDPDVSVMQLDFWALMNPAVADSIKLKYLDIVQHHSDLYDRVYALDEHHWRKVLDGDEYPPADVLELTEVILGSRNGIELVAGALGPYPSDLLLFPTAFATLPRLSARRRAAMSTARAKLMRYAWTRLQRRVAQQIGAFEPHVIVSTQMIPAALVSALKATGELSTPTVGVVTDFGVHDFWVQPGTDHYCVADQSMCAEPFGRAERDRVEVTGVPLCAGFEHPPAAVASRQALGLDPARPVVLVLGGGLGIGIEYTARLMLAETSAPQIVVLSGQACVASAELGRLAKLNPRRLTVHEWTDDMPLYMAAASVVVGKPGGLTVAECLASGRPLLATRRLGGQEGFNTKFLEQHGFGAFQNDDELMQRIDQLLAHEALLDTMSRRALELGGRNGARRIASRVIELADRQISNTPRTAIQ